MSNNTKHPHEHRNGQARARNRAIETVLTHHGRKPGDQFGVVNTPVYRASTVLYPDFKTLKNRSQPYVYGRRGTPSSKSVEDVITTLEGGEGSKLAPSGMSAISCALMSVLASGDELLISDSAYEPTRMLADGYLARMGVSTRYFDPRIGGEIVRMIGKNTRAIMLESPGSLTFELNDIPAISSAVQGREISIIVDNTWGTPLYYNPLALGANIVVHAGTKMFVGHSDAMFGTITCDTAHWPALEETHGLLGLCAAPDDCFLAARGLRTLALRMKEHSARSIKMAQWLEGQDIVQEVLHPGLTSHPDHDIFVRDFRGAGSLFSFCLPRANQAALAAMLDNMELFGMGYSWGGFESLILPIDLKNKRTSTAWPNDHQIIRIHIGLEDFGELRNDIAAGIARYKAAM
ncbi:MAG TPA: cystathionine beta-lyase [Devosia sp.]|nr:cystathionine beta-lyase [Devosia sp.]